MRYLIFLLVIYPKIGFSQNLVLNPGFEDTLCCPIGGNFSCVANWYVPNGISSTPDFHWNSCYFNSYACSNLIQDYNFNNQGIVGFFANGGGNDSREYISSKLSIPLNSSKTYCIEFYLKICSKFIITTSSVGLYIGDSLFSSGSGFFSTSPQISNPSNRLINDTTVWYKINGTYQASGGEQFITIGNFNTDLNSNYDTLNWGVDLRTYFMVDNFSILECDDDSLDIVIPNVFTPNRDEINDVWELEIYNVDRLEGIIYNRWGEIVHQFLYDSRTVGASDRFFAWDGHTFIAGMPVPDGVYYYQLTATKFNGELENFTGIITLLR